jgi:ATP-dependent Clp protease ATP-binding subunit ClpX
MTSLNSLTRDDLVRILKEPKNAMTKQYQVLMAYDGVQLEFEEDALGAIADKAIEMQIGARGLRSVAESVMTDIMYNVPSDPSIIKVVITADCVKNGTEPLVIRRNTAKEIVS